MENHVPQDSLQEKDSQGDQRCKCNKLLCVIKGNNIEIKCNKCKRMMVIKTLGIQEIETT